MRKSFVPRLSFMKPVRKFAPWGKSRIRAESKYFPGGARTARAFRSVFRGTTGPLGYR
jgi:hypothetical protein